MITIKETVQENPAFQRVLSDSPGEITDAGNLRFGHDSEILHGNTDGGLDADFALQRSGISENHPFGLVLQADCTNRHAPIFQDTWRSGATSAEHNYRSKPSPDTIPDPSEGAVKHECCKGITGFIRGDVAGIHGMVKL